MAREYDHLFKLLIIGDSGKPLSFVYLNDLNIIAVGTPCKISIMTNVSFYALLLLACSYKDLAAQAMIYFCSVRSDIMALKVSSLLQQDIFFRIFTVILCIKTKMKFILKIVLFALQV